MNLFKKISKEGWLLLLIFIFVLAFRLYFVFQSKNFSSDEAYFHLRHINYILENNKILFYGYSFNIFYALLLIQNRQPNLFMVIHSIFLIAAIFACDCHIIFINDIDISSNFKERGPGINQTKERGNAVFRCRYNFN